MSNVIQFPAPKPEPSTTGGAFFQALIALTNRPQCHHGLNAACMYCGPGPHGGHCDECGGTCFRNLPDGAA